MSSLRTCAIMFETHLFRVIFCLRELYNPFALHVALVAHDNDWEFGANLLAQLLYPLRHFVEGVLICYVVHDKGTYTH